MTLPATAPPQAGRPNIILCGLFCLSILIVAYASLLPFSGWRVPDAVSMQGIQRVYQSELDLILNVLAYVPVGLLLAAILRQTGARHPLRFACIATCLLSLSLESLQLLLPGRVTALHDWFANSAGGVIGAMLALSRTGSRAANQLLLLRERWLNPSQHAEVGFLLLLVWLVAQSNPAIPFFEAGHLANELTRGWQAAEPGLLSLAPQIVAIALNVCGFALFIGVWVGPRIFAGVPVLLVLAAGFTLKFLAAGLLLKAPLLETWLGPASTLGLIAGYFLALLLLDARPRTRLFLALLLIFGGGLMARMAGIYEGLDAMLRLFHTSHGQLGTFANFTLWLNELWPVAAFLYLVVLFMRGWGRDA